MKPKRKFWSRLRAFFWPSAEASFVRRIAPYAFLTVVALAFGLGTTAGWSYTNSVTFCGTTCHTMPPQYNTYLRSPHSRVTCVECHLGRDSLLVQLPRKVQHSHTLYAMIFKTYEYPIVAKQMRPANEACETCHYPAKFTTDSLSELRSHANDEANTAVSTLLLLKIGGGAKREGLGRGIHWHIENQVYFLATDAMEQQIPYIRVVKDDGSTDEFIDVDSGYTPEMAQGKTLRQMDCITCHNRITHSIPSPEQSVDTALYSGAISDNLPFVRQKAVELLNAGYADATAANAAFDGLAKYYQDAYPQVYADKLDAIGLVIDFLKSTHVQTRFPDQKLDWNTHPNNTGHKDSPGCFRCHDGKHLNANQQAIRLECNLCHSIPVVADPSEFLPTVSVVRGAEPASHTSTQWIALHGKAINLTCAQCHPPADDATDLTRLNGKIPPVDGSFCGNSACHVSEWKFAGFKSPGLQFILQEQLKQVTAP